MHLSQEKKRNQIYLSFLNSQKSKTTQDVISLGLRLMRKYKLHPHFFRSNTLLETAQYLTFHALKWPHDYKNSFYLSKELSQEEIFSIFSLFEERIAKRIPVEYITNTAYFEDREFYVNEHVLVPRTVMRTRFSDFLAETQWENFRVLDLCTGSGCIGITLALQRPDIQVDLVDISRNALDVAAINIKRFSLENRVRCIESDLFSNVTEKYDLIISNPPYVATSEYEKCPLEFKNEPKIALESGKDGLDILNSMLSQAKHFLNPKGKLIVEVGTTTAKRLKKKYRNIPFQWFPYRRPNGKIPLLAMDCIFQCEASDL